MATLEEKIANLKTGSLGTGISLEDRISQVAGSGLSNVKSLEERIASKGQAAEDEIFSGGFFSDILDIVQTPQYFATGLLTPGISGLEAIQQRYTPADALGIENPFARFAVDVVLDPLNFLGAFGATAKGMKAVKAGEAAATLGGAAAKGEKVLFGLTKPFSSEVVAPIIKGEGVLKGITKGVEAAKTIPGIKQVSQLFDAGPTGMKSVDAIENLATVARAEKLAKLEARGITSNFAEKSIMKFKTLRDDALKLIDEGKVTETQYNNIIRKIASPAKEVDVPDALQGIFKEMRDEFNALNKAYKKAGGPKLEGKVVTSVFPKAEDARKAFPSQFKEFGAAGSEQFAKNTGFKNLAGDVLIGESKNKTKATLFQKLAQPTATGSSVKNVAIQKVKGVGDDFAYTTTKNARDIDNAAKKALVENLDKPIKEQKRLAQAAREAAYEQIKKTDPNSIFKRVAPDLDQLNEIRRLLGKSELSLDPGVVGAIQANDVARLVGRQQYVDRLREFGVPVLKRDALPAGMQRVKIKGLGDLAFPETVAGHIDSTYKAFSNIEEVNDFVKAYDKLLNLWEGTATFINPAFHSRNAVSNHWQMWLAGVSNPVTHAKGYLYKLGKEIPKGADAKYVKEFAESGLSRTGAFTADISKEVSKWQDNWLFNVGGKAGDFLEDSAKLSLYLDKRAKGYNPQAAAMEVRKYLFDYSDLTAFEKNVMKRIFPFYTWTRKNLPLQVATLIQKPEKILIISKAKAAIEDSRGGESMPEKYLPEWLKEAYPIYFGSSDNGLQRFIKLEGFLPTVDLNQLGRIANGEIFLESLSPIIKTPIELVANYDFYFENQIEEFEGQKGRIGLVPGTSIGIDVPKKLEKVLRTFRPLGELQKFVVDDARESNPTILESFANFLIGKTYQLDPDRQEQIFEWMQQKEIGKIKADLEDAEVRGSKEEVKRLEELMDQLEEGVGVKL